MAPAAPEAPPRAPPTEVEVAVIGGGLGGLAVAAGLLHRGRDVHVFEAARVLRVETSTMIGLGPNAFTALGDIHPELPGDVRSRGVANSHTSYRYFPRDGRPPFTMERTEAEMRLVTVRWAQAQDALACLVPEERVHCNHAAIGYDEIWDEQDEHDTPGAQRGRASAAVVHFRGQPSVRARLVVAADGVFSALRAHMYPNDPGPRYLGHMNWNCLVPTASLPPGIQFHNPGQLVFTTNGALGEPLLEPSLFNIVCDAGGGFTFWQVRQYSEEPSFTTDALAAAATAAVDGALSAPAAAAAADASAPATSPSPAAAAGATEADCSRGGGGAKLDGAVTAAAATAAAAAAGGAGKAPAAEASAEPTEEAAMEGAAQEGEGGNGKGEGEEEDDGGQGGGGRTGRERVADGGGRRRGRGGQGVPGSKARVLASLKEVGWDWALPLVQATPESSIFERALYDRLPLKRWASPGARVVLLGDSAHGMHPGPGQGARSAFEDAHQLTLALGALWPHVPRALERYQEARVLRATRVQTLAAEMAGRRDVREAARPPGLTGAQHAERWREFRTWFDKYPQLMDGDPSTTWWKPLANDNSQPPTANDQPADSTGTDDVAAASDGAARGAEGGGNSDGGGTGAAAAGKGDGEGAGGAAVAAASALGGGGGAGAPLPAEAAAMGAGGGTGGGPGPEVEAVGKTGLGRGGGAGGGRQAVEVAPAGP
ncbi:hypothetical protein HYH03_004522 [Edaphochlamys debaryana]|uniref:FAD-binding domain-containing protein n=1 Tax=Edaphochlamys debaryana TaxID=47281 RepID=A0A835Y9R8_9CHLO|nr:hypothetical protein HYH03_004522 [Edaphochlamys debaryana]|eukprot:KAG2497363.1 hypothetical protein HYH03_004522 [Edaphochlamys debaryana]